MHLRNIFMSLLLIAASICIPASSADQATAYMARPNRESGLERFLGLGVVFPYPYFQKPKYRYPVYDNTGRGYLAYGYGGPETYKYTKFNLVEGYH